MGISFLLALPQVAFVMAPYFADDVHGAKNLARIVYENEWWRLATPILLHTGWYHLSGNLTIQFRAGVTLEYLWGHGVFLIIYMGSGIYGNLASCVFLPDALSVGASGSLCGIIGAWPVYLAMTWDQVDDATSKRKRDLVMLVLILSIILVMCTSFIPPTDFAAHFGGLMMGALLAMTVFGPKMTSGKWGAVVSVLGALTVGVALVVTVWYILEVIEPDTKLLAISD